MSLRTVLRLDEQLDDVNDTWAEWSAAEPALRPFACLRDIQHWRLEAPWQDYREVLLAIGRLTQVEETAERAMATMMELVMPAMNRTLKRYARRYGQRDSTVCEVAAAHLWAAIDAYPWHEPRAGWIVQGLTRDVCRAVDRDLLQSGDRREPIHSVPTDALGLDLQAAPTTPGNTPIQASEVYVWAVTEVGISVADMELLVELAVLASADRSRTHGRGGLGSMQLCRVVGERSGATARQVQYRAERALQRLQAHVARAA